MFKLYPKTTFDELASYHHGQTGPQLGYSTDPVELECLDVVGLVELCPSEELVGSCTVKCRFHIGRAQELHKVSQPGF